MDHQDEKAHEAANIAVSVFRNFWDKEPVASTLEAVINAIRSDSRTKELTTGLPAATSGRTEKREYAVRRAVCVQRWQGTEERREADGAVDGGL